MNWTGLHSNASEMIIPVDFLSFGSYVKTRKDLRGGPVIEIWGNNQRAKNVKAGTILGPIDEVMVSPPFVAIVVGSHGFIFENDPNRHTQIKHTSEENTNIEELAI